MLGKIGLEEHFAVEETVGHIPAGLKNAEERKKKLLDIFNMRVAEMDKYGMDLMILSLNSPAIQETYNAREAVDLARRCNDHLAECIARRPDRFRGFAALPMQDDSARLLLEAMIFAARADGHIDENEKAHIQEAAARLFPGQSADALVARSLEQPLDPGALAARVRNREEALDLYRISAMITGGDHFMERSYLDALAASLGIGAAEKATLDAQVAEFRQQQAAM